MNVSRTLAASYNAAVFEVQIRQRRRLDIRKKKLVAGLKKTSSGSRALLRTAFRGRRGETRTPLGLVLRQAPLVWPTVVDPDHNPYRV